MRIRITFIGWYLLAILAVIALCCLLSGCRSEKFLERYSEIRNVSRLFDRMDSLVHTTAVWQQDIYSRQSSLVDSIRQMERNDSNHIVVVNENGDTVKEKIVIERVIERERSTDSRDSEIWMQRYRETDSLLRVSLDKQAVTDSLLKEHMKETVIEKKPSWLQKTWQSVVNVMAALGTLAVILLVIYLLHFRKKG